jgi:hypothetical protein
MTGEKWHNVGENGNGRCIATLGVTPAGEVFGIRCKRWACNICAPINALYKAIETANGVQALFAAGIRPYFVTITQPPAVKTASFAYSILASQWDGFRNRWQYWAKSKGVPNFYAAFVEGQARRDGMPHFHVIGTAIPKKTDLKAWVTAAGLGYMADVQPVSPNSGVAWYVSKYSTKGSDAALMPKNFRRVRFSQDWPRMLFRHDIREGEAIVKRANESVVSWTYRAALAFNLNPDNIAQDAIRTLDAARTDEAATYQETLSAYLVTS